jgi:hypothetical protein
MKTSRTITASTIATATDIIAAESILDLGERGGTAQCRRGSGEIHPNSEEATSRPRVRG